ACGSRVAAVEVALPEDLQITRRQRPRYPPLDTCRTASVHPRATAGRLEDARDDAPTPAPLTNVVVVRPQRVRRHACRVTRPRSRLVACSVATTLLRTGSSAAR